MAAIARRCKDKSIDAVCICVALQRISPEMGRSQFADFLRYLMRSLVPRSPPCGATRSP
ncbi:hypothetical protein SBA4_3790002 [Candidatus Sulfopaludibacter sp. SbA4]|nr:hypothetical protein SBA4_3790002 [Candidatus Sulfopaludibacter sp. SbA4]